MRTRTTWIITGVLAALVLAAAVMFTISQTGDGGPEISAPPRDAEHGLEGPQPETADPATAARHALAAMFSWQPAVDPSPGQGLVRARPWLTGQLADQADAPLATGVRPLPDWAAWRNSRDVVTATVAADQISDTDDGECVVTATVTQIVQHTDGSSTRYRVMTVSAAMQHTENGWRMSSYRLTTPN